LKTSLMKSIVSLPATSYQLLATRLRALRYGEAGLTAAR
jgi:hypothetical protein